MKFEVGDKIWLKTRYATNEYGKAVMVKFPLAIVAVEEDQVTASDGNQTVCIPLNRPRLDIIGRMRITNYGRLGFWFSGLHMQEMMEYIAPYMGYKRNGNVFFCVDPDTNGGMIGWSCYGESGAEEFADSKGVQELAQKDASRALSEEMTKPAPMARVWSQITSWCKRNILCGGR